MRLPVLGQRPRVDPLLIWRPSRCVAQTATAWKQCLLAATATATAVVVVVVGVSCPDVRLDRGHAALMCVCVRGVGV